VHKMTRRQLKEDELLTTVEWFQKFGKENYKELLGGVAAVVLIAASIVGWRTYDSAQEAAANMALGTALKTYHSYVGAPAAEPGTDSFPTVQARDQRALTQFKEIADKYKHRKAGQIALYLVGVCQSDLGDSASAIKTLQQAAEASDRDVASLAQFALAGELVRSGKLADATKLYQQLADHPTVTVPKATALMAMADAQRATQPAVARKIYEGLAKEFASDGTLANTLKEQIASLSQ
jgi:predicted negative regulator of RcsB-dependent stress response